MATKKSGGKGGASKKGGGGGKGSPKKGTSKKRGLGSVLSNIGTVAGAVGSIAGTVGGLAGGNKRELAVGVGANATLNDITAALKNKFNEIGCRACRSGIDRITFKDLAAGGGGGGR